jgi:outer membrane receptor protein involved in Fe transport
MSGQVVSVANLGTPGGLVSQGAAINTQTSDMGNMVNDLSLSKQFKLGDAASVDLHGGLYHMRQNVVQRWAISERAVEVGQNGAVIDIYNAAGQALTTAGLTGYNNQWGACCARDINAQFTTDAPYLTMDLAAGNWDFDGGIRRESFHTNASYAGSKALTGGLDVNGDGVINGAETNVFVSDTAHPGLANYTVNYTNYSLGANYRITKDLSVFAHASKGNRAIADRLLFSANIDASTGALTSGGKTAALAPVKQMELGVKNKGKTGFGQYAVAATLFHSTTTEFDYDQTRQDNPNLPNYAGPKLNIVGYKSDGVEVESSLGFGNFSLNANLTYTKEVITTNLGAPQFIGKNEPGVPKLRYNITPTYGFGPLTVGATIRGGSSVWNDGGNTVSIDGHFVVNAFANYDFGNGLVATANVGNLFDKLYPVGSGGFVNGSSTVFGAGVETGRTITAGIKYRF